METRRFVQGDPETDPSFFSLIGPWALSADVEKRIGVSVTGRGGDVWFIALLDDSMPVGFTCARPFKHGSVHVRYLFAAADDDETRDVLLQAVLTDAVSQTAKRIYTNDRRAATAWRRQGFMPHPTKRRGEFIPWILETKR